MELDLNVDGDEFSIDEINVDVILERESCTLAALISFKIEGHTLCAKPCIVRGNELLR